MMSFLQDVSDRVEKLQFENDPLRTLEKNGRFVVKDDWIFHVDTMISEDIRKYRGYMGASVRDLLRAFRNKVRNMMVRKQFTFLWHILYCTGFRDGEVFASVQLTVT